MESLLFSLAVCAHATITAHLEEEDKRRKRESHCPNATRAANSCSNSCSNSRSCGGGDGDGQVNSRSAITRDRYRLSVRGSRRARVSRIFSGSRRASETENIDGSSLDEYMGLLASTSTCSVDSGLSRATTLRDG